MLILLESSFNPHTSQQYTTMFVACNMKVFRIKKKKLLTKLKYTKQRHLNFTQRHSL